VFPDREIKKIIN